MRIRKGFIYFTKDDTADGKPAWIQIRNIDRVIPSPNGSYIAAGYTVTDVYYEPEEIMGEIEEADN